MPKAQGGNAAGTDDKELMADLKAFAAQLGLGGGGGGSSDAAFDDFAPEKANKRIGSDAKAGKKAAAGGRERQQDGGKQPPQDGKQAAGRKDGASGGGDKRQGRSQDQQQQGRRQEQQQQPRKGEQQQQRGGRQQQGENERGGWQQQQGQGQQRAPQQRSWQQQPWQEEEASGPKIPNAKSILPRDEPTIWFEAASSLPPLPLAEAEAAPDLVQPRRKQAERLLLVEEQAFEQDMGRRSSADAKWLQQVRRSGTTADKVAAMSVLVQDGAVANLKSLDGLLAMCSKKGGARAVVGSAMDALKELFTAVLLPDRKLRFFEQQPMDKLENGREGERRLLYWLLEDGIKKRYAQFVESLEACSRDNLEYVKDRSVKCMFDLLSSKPEQEQRLLSGLVNKLGDPDRKLASKVGYLLTRLLADHPGMNLVVVREIERFMFRPGLLDRARYYAVVYLNQMVLTHKQTQESKQGGSLARRLIDVYFTVFQMILDGKIGTAAQLAKQQQDKAAVAAASRKRGEAAKARAADAARQAVVDKGVEHSGEMDGRMLAALITGVRRAFPYVPPEEVEPLIEAHADALFRLVHARSFGVATQALLLLFQLMSSRSTVSDRFYRALYAVLGSPELYRSTKAPMFLSLLYKALKADVSSRRASAFAKRVLQLAQESPPHFACGCLLLTSEMLKARPALWGAVLQPEESDADGLERFQDAPEDSPSQQQQQQQAEQQRGANGDSSGANGGGGRAVAAQIDVAGDGEEGSDAELAESSDSGEDSGAEDEQQQQQLQPPQQDEEQLRAAEAAQRRAAAAVAMAAAMAAAEAKWPSTKEAYDMHKRQPEFSNADRSCLWELTSLAAHVHPSVAAMARTLLAGQSVMYDGDPLRDLTLGAFLEKFVQKKAKAAAKGDSAMQPLAAQQAVAAAAAGPQQWAALAGAHTQALAALAEKDVRPDDMFFHKFYSLQAVQAKAAKKKKKKGGDDEALLSDADSDDSDAADDFLAGQEEGGDDGIGADPDRSGMDYDYGSLAAAMDSDSAGEGSEDDDKVDELAGSDAELASDDEDEPAGAAFSDMSDSGSEGGEEEGAAAAAAAAAGVSDSDAELAGSDADLSDSGADSDSEDDGFEAELAAGDLSDGQAGSSGSSSSDEDDAAADAEVAELMQRHGIKPAAAAAAAAAPKGAAARGGAAAKAAAKAAADDGGSDSDSLDSGLNPFELAEASSSSDGEEEQQRQQRPRGKQQVQQQHEVVALKKRKKSSGSGGGESGSIFAAADDYEDMIEKDLADPVGRDDGEKDAPGGAVGAARRALGGGGGKRPRGSSSGGGAGGPPKQQQRGGGSGGGRPAKRR